MNLITCSSDCIHQKDGYCTLDKPAHVTGMAVGGCCYYETARAKAPRRKKRSARPR